MYFQRRRGTQVLVYYRTAAGNLKTIPRDQVRHLDHEPDHNVQAWINDHQGRWEPTGEAPKGLVLSDASLEEWVTAWAAHRTKRGYGTKNTVTRAKHALLEDVVPYFLAMSPPRVDPNTWVSASFGLVDWQEQRGVSEANRIHARTALRKWWKWLGDTRRIQPGLDLPLDSTRRTGKATTLSLTPTPEDVLRFVRFHPDERIRLMALLGYFASLRPQEVFALRRCDFVAGATEAGRVMKEKGHFDRLSVNITQQRTQRGELTPPKAFSRGLVAIFDVHAATLIREILLRREPEELLFDFLPNWNAELWKRGGGGLTLHDLRKASLYWLGHYGNLELVQLKNHARHSKVDTTMLYCRRPAETVEQNLDLAW
jgi:integrase